MIVPVGYICLKLDAPIPENMVVEATLKGCAKEGLLIVKCFNAQVECPRTPIGRGNRSRAYTVSVRV